MVAIQPNRLPCLCERPEPPIEVVEVHVTRRPYGAWCRTDLILLPTCRRVRLKSNPNVVAMVRCRKCVIDGVLYVIADARNSEWVGPEGGSFVFALNEQLEAERLAIEGL